MRWRAVTDIDRTAGAAHRQRRLNREVDVPDRKSTRTLLACGDVRWWSVIGAHKSA
jgi:hypothetical protein